MTVQKMTARLRRIRAGEADIVDTDGRLLGRVVQTTQGGWYAELAGEKFIRAAHAVPHFPSRRAAIDWVTTATLRTR